MEIIKVTGIFVFAITFTTGTYSTSVKRCCDGNLPVLDYHRMCLNGKSIALDCPQSAVRILNNEWGGLSSYSHGVDSMGTFIDAYEQGIIFREPHYCEALGIHSFSDNITKALVFVCIEEAEIRNDDGVLDDLSVTEPPPPTNLNLYRVVIEICNFVSAITLAATATVYGFLKNIQDTHATCIFHFTTCIGLYHAAMFYVMFFNPYGLFPDFCITNMYLRLYTVLCAFFWCVVVGFNSWIQIKATPRLDESKLLIRYRLFGYGTPALLILLCNLYAHGAKLYTEYRFEMDCLTHQTLGITYFCAIPLFILQVANCFFYFDMQRRIWYGMMATSGRSFIRKMKYRLIMDAQLFFTLGIPWALIYALHITSYLVGYSEIIFFLSYITFIILSGEGVFMFAILVVFRKRVLKGILHYWLPNTNLFPHAWKAFVNSLSDPETVEDIDANEAPISESQKYNTGTIKSNTDHESNAGIV